MIWDDSTAPWKSCVITYLPQLPRQGWQCPVCKRVYAPDFPMCVQCGPKRTTTITTSSPVKMQER
jgi:hypothetical protein